MTNIYHALMKAPAEAIALGFADGRTMSYGDLDHRAARYGAMLRARGVAAGDRIVVQVEKSAEALALYLGSLRAGAVFVPLNTAYTAAERDYFVCDAEPRLIVVDPLHADELGGQGDYLTLDAEGRGSAADSADAAGEDCPIAECGADALAAILYTSGTTGRSKGAMLSHGNLTSNARTLVDFWRFEANDTLLHALPIYHAHGLFVGIHVLLMAGGRILFLPRFDLDSVIDLLPQATAFMGVPTYYVRLLGDDRLTRERAASMRLFVSGSAPLLAETHRAWTAKTGHMILERYGMTETGMNASNPYDGTRVPGKVGPALPGVSLRVVDAENGAVLPAGEIGMLEVRGPNVFGGYWRMPEKTAAEFRADGYFITGDLAMIDEQGYVQIVGRGKDLVISGGFNIYPKEVEVEIDQIEGVLESAVIGLPHADFGEAVTAVVVPRAGAILDKAMILDALRPRLARFKLPKEVVLVAELPRNTMGKVQKNVLRTDHAALYEGVT